MCVNHKRKWAIVLPLPTRVSRDSPVGGYIDLETLRDLVYMGFPPHAQPNTVRFFFKLDKDGKSATRVRVKLGRASVNAIEVLDGPKEGDRVVLSDMTNYDNVERIKVNLASR
jgi:HlyD family secretion protein